MCVGSLRGEGRGGGNQEEGNAFRHKRFIYHGLVVVTSLWEL